MTAVLSFFPSQCFGLGIAPRLLYQMHHAHSHLPRRKAATQPLQIRHQQHGLPLRARTLSLVKTVASATLFIARSCRTCIMTGLHHRLLRTPPAPAPPRLFFPIPTPFPPDESSRRKVI